MHTNPSHEKGLSASNAQAPMHTEADCLAPPVRVQRPLSPRQARVLSALLQAPQTREQVDRTAGASNGPDVVANLRRRIGLVIPVAFSSVKDLDGRSVERGIYSLTSPDRERALSFLEELASTASASTGGQ